ncbi:MipA/OmpV family protein [Thiotrichales bacterium 19S11-10]|nr:MipA/OmpV family protein [Thiotrichales bacterium 19S11-10]
MERLSVLLFSVFLSLSFFSDSYAQAGVNEHQDLVDKPNTLGIGIGGIIAPDPYKNTSTTILPIPVVSYQGERLKISGPFIDYRFLNYPMSKTSVQLFLYPEHFRSNQSSDPQMEKLNNRNYLVMAGVNQKLLLKAYGVLNFSASFDITTQSNGFVLFARYNKPFFFTPVSDDKLIINPGVGLQYSNHLLTDYFYGISSSESNSSGISEYHPNGAISPFINLTTIYSFAKHWNLSLITALSRLSNTEADSPMVSKRYIFTTYFSVVYKF